MKIETTPRILAMEASTELCSVALYSGAGCSERQGHAGTRADESLLSMATVLLGEKGIRPAQLTAVAYGRGPGSFVGVRVAAALAQGITLAHNLPLCAESSLAAMALQSPPGTRVAPITDAGLNDYYWSCYERTTAGLDPVMDERVGTAVDVAAWLLAEGGPGTVPVGSGWPSLLTRAPEITTLAPKASATVRPRALHILQLAMMRLEAGISQGFQETLPVYPLGSSKWRKAPPIRTLPR